MPTKRKGASSDLETDVLSEATQYFFMQDGRWQHLLPLPGHAGEMVPMQDQAQETPTE